MMNIIKMVGAGLFSTLVIVLFAGGYIWWEAANWRVCLADHPWWYCLRILWF
jgi:hypothetical protein